MGNCEECLEIYTLGMFVIKKGNTVITEKYSRTQKPFELYKYLISCKNTSVNPEVLAEALSANSSYNNPVKAVHNLVYRLRQMLIEDASDKNNLSSIKFLNGCYMLDLKSNIKLDVQEFETLCKEAQYIGNYKKEEAINLYKKAFSLYKGRFLHENEYDDWVISARNYYHNLYLKSIHGLVRLYNTLNKYDDIIDICEKAFLFEFFDEDIHAAYLRALIEKGKNRQALAHYEYATSMLYKQAGIKPSGEMTMIYKSIKRGKNSIEFDLPSVEKQLSKDEVNKGAILCDLDIFQFIYKLEKHQVKRGTQPACLVLLTLVHNDSIIPSASFLKEEMEKLRDLLVNSLRGTDVITQWSEAQFLLLLYGLNHEHLDIIFNRITKNYEKIRNTSQMRLVNNSKQL